jgi:hypothetical protein
MENLYTVHFVTLPLGKPGDTETEWLHSVLKPLSPCSIYKDILVRIKMHKTLQAALGPVVYSASNRSEY